MIPPPGFKFDAKGIEEIKNELVIPRPLEQQVMVGRGFYDLKLLGKKPMLVGEYKKLVDKDAQKTKGRSAEEIEKTVG